MRTFLRIGQVKKQLAPRATELWANFVENGPPDVIHGGQHRPIDKTDELRFLDPPHKFVEAEARLDVVPVDLLERLVFALHDFAILELDGIRVPRLGDRMNIGNPGEVGEHGVDVGITEIAEVTYLESETGQGIGHDRTVAPELRQLDHHFDIGAFAGGPGEPLGVFGDGGQAEILLGALALVHHMEDFIDKAIEADEGIDALNCGCGRFQYLGALVA